MEQSPFPVRVPGEGDGLAGIVGLQGAALEQIDQEAAVLADVHGEFHIHRILVDFLELLQDFLHGGHEQLIFKKGIEADVVNIPADSPFPEHGLGFVVMIEDIFLCRLGEHGMHLIEG